MPYKSAKQQAFMHAQHPEIAKKWDKEQKASGKPFPEKSMTRAHLAHHSPTKDTPRKSNMKLEGSKGAKVVDGGRGPLPGGKPVGGEDRSHSGAMENEKAAKAGPHAGHGGTAAMETPDDGQDMALAQRGMSSGHAAKAWKATGYKVPAHQGEDHAPGASGAGKVKGTEKGY